jgi:hypothetical protein
MEAIYSFETSVDFQRTTRHYILEERNFHIHRRENLEPSYMKSRNGSIGNPQH